MAGNIDNTPFLHSPFLRGGQSQTIASKYAKYPRICFSRQRLFTPDHDFIDIDWNVPTVDPIARPNPQQKEQKPQEQQALPAFTGKAIALWHGLEGSSQSHYAQSLCHDFRQHGWAVAVIHFRGCSGEPNLLPRSYFSGDTQDVEYAVHALQALLPNAQWFAAGISMGGSVLLNYVGKQDPSFNHFNAVASISTPTDLYETGLHLGNGFFNRYVYTPYFLVSMKEKMRKKHQHFPDAIDIVRLEKSKTLKEFDDFYTAPIHGFKDAKDYWTTCSSKHVLADIRTPTLILNALNDPFIPPSSLPTVHDVSASVTLHQPDQGGHAGFAQGRWPITLGWLSQRLLHFFS